MNGWWWGFEPLERGLKGLLWRRLSPTSHRVQDTPVIIPRMPSSPTTDSAKKHHSRKKNSRALHLRSYPN